MTRTIIAVATGLFFGCASVRAPGLPVAEPLVTPSVTVAEPELDLWLEGATQIDPAESARALAEARAALGEAVAGRGFGAGAEAEQVLTVRAAGIARTDGRKSAQVLAGVGMVLVIVGVVVLLASGSKSSGRRAPAHPGALPAPQRVGAAVPAPTSRAWRGARRSVGSPWPWWEFGIYVRAPLYARGSDGVDGYWSEDGIESRLPSRGFFDGDEMRIAVELRDARSGELLWSRAVSGGVDPRDRGAVRALLDQALAGAPVASPRQTR